MKRKILILSLILLASSYFTICAYTYTTDATLRMDKTSYFGYGAQPKVTLTFADLNTNPRLKESVEIIACSTSDPAGVNIKLTETSKDSGIFTGVFSLDKTQSDEKSGKLKITYDDIIIVKYKDSLTYSAKWLTSTATIKFNKSSYLGLNSSAIITLTDQDLNLRTAYIDASKIRITSEADPQGIVVSVYETGQNTGIFTGTLSFSSVGSDSENDTIKINPTDNIIAAYIDERNAVNQSNTVVTAASGFQFSEAKLETSAVNGEGTGNLLDITITEPDANNPKVKDRIIAKAGSYDRNDEMTLWLVETGNNTGIFKCRLFLNGENTTSGSLQVGSADNINLKYVDNTVPYGGAKEILKTIKWKYESTLLKLDKQTYIGYHSPAKITLMNMELNEDKGKIDYVDVEVGSLTGSRIKLELKETSSDSGEFTGTIYFGKSSKSSDRIVKVSGMDTISVTYVDEKNDNDIYECYADWSPQDGQLTLDRKEYNGNNAPVRITVKDWDLADDTGEKDEIRVHARVTGSFKDISVILTETSKNTGMFTGMLYINGTGSNKPSISLNAADRLEIVYTDEDTTSGGALDRIVDAVWGGVSEAKLTLDKAVYKGYDAYMTITLTDPDQNKSATARDKVYITVKTENSNFNEEYSLTETGSNTGIFTAKLKLTKDASSIGSIRVKPEDTITVTFRSEDGDKRISISAAFIER